MRQEVAGARLECPAPHSNPAIAYPAGVRRRKRCVALRHLFRRQRLECQSLLELLALLAFALRGFSVPAHDPGWCVLYTPSVAPDWRGSKGQCRLRWGAVCPPAGSFAGTYSVGVD